MHGHMNIRFQTHPSDLTFLGTVKEKPQVCAQ